MMPLPPGCKLVYSVWIDVDKLTQDMIEWYCVVEGEVRYDHYYNTRNREQIDAYVRYGKGKWCHHHHNGHGGTRLHFMGEDAHVASMFLLKFNEHVTANNMQQALDQYNRELELDIR